MNEFNGCLYAFELDDLRFSGCFFTWANKQDHAHHVTTKLDRVLVNEQWMKDYSCSSAHFPTPGISDHSLVWRKVIFGNPMFCVCEKLKLLQGEFKIINIRDFSDVSKRVVDTRQLLESLQKDLGSQSSNLSVISQEKEVHKQLLTLLRTEESLAKQKSRIQWLKLGDQCISYFFKAVSSSRNRSKITSLVLDDGSLINDITDIKSNFVNFYTNLLGTAHPTSYHGLSRIQQVLGSRLSDSAKS
ncbi:uncharacterized protein LOC131330032 [Rhododendron vialii]|uniref:uncharacterized protein LOC131330032 n=1 Tax=Rhododendron vialii TaxID=182163 RepID=UPI00265EF11B|nr:uncharacterized protein LOC131330032 [Rhododendron vialii]